MKKLYDVWQCNEHQLPHKAFQTKFIGHVSARSPKEAVQKITGLKVKKVVGLSPLRFCVTSAETKRTFPLVYEQITLQ
ncbi:MAG: hypothetical protein OXF06_13495 [Bacteroidetes bacterium]|nr:hypothetical protein [Bacteroidota bacterium]